LQVEAKVLSDLEKAGRGQLISSFGSLIERVLFNLSDPESSYS
jgi:peptide/nickel transport system substrate-binding protein